MLEDDREIGKVTISDNETLKKKRKQKRGIEGKEGIKKEGGSSIRVSYDSFFFLQSISCWAVKVIFNRGLNDHFSTELITIMQFIDKSDAYSKPHSHVRS